MEGNIKLSILISYYNIEKYIGELLEALAPQIRDDIEVILTDDGSDVPFKSSYEWLKVIRIEPNRGTSHARNVALEAAEGNYIAFIDGDDVVAKDYVEQILERIKGNPDYIELSWRAIDIQDIRFHNKATLTAKLANPSACTRVFKREFIGDLRFNENKESAEDEDFTRHLHLDRGKRAYIEKWMYYYRVDRENSQSMRFRQGLSNTKLIIYHYRHVTADMTHLVEEIKKEDEKNEVWLFTGRCDIPELAEHCRIRRPFPMWANELRGEPCDLVHIRETPVKTQVVIYSSTFPGADGISTWTKNFCQWMHKIYDITVIYGAASEAFLEELRPIVRTVKNKKERVVTCSIVLMMRIADALPPNIKTSHTWQVVHTVNDGHKRLPKRDKYIFVSNVSRRSFGVEGSVIYNLPAKGVESSLIFVSTCRIDGSDKGRQNERMIKLAKMLRDAHIKFIWFYFSKTSLTADGDMVRIDPARDVRPFLRMADYLVQLSDSEAYCYSIAEALEMHVPVICTPLPVLEELEFRNKVDGYIVPFNMDFNVGDLLDKWQLTPMLRREASASKVAWEILLGDMEPADEYVPEEKKKCEVLKPYFDMVLQKDMKPGEQAEMWTERAKSLKNMGLVRII